MSYIGLFEVASLWVLGIIWYDYRIKRRIYRTDGVLFQLVLVSCFACSLTDLLSGLMIDLADAVPLRLNVALATLYFILQASTVYALVCFSFLYMTPSLSWRSRSLWGVTALFAVNLFLGAASPWTGWYFRFDETLHYRQGPLSNWGYYFFYLNMAACVVYAVYHFRRILVKDFKVTLWVALFVSVGVSYQFCHRSILFIGFSMAVSVLYLYLTLENPNDYQDKLTLCGNSYALKICVDQHSKRHRAFTVFFLDINQFRYINALYGNDTGDYLLRQVAVYLEKTFPRSLVFRDHDDAFALYCPGPQKKNEAVAEQIRARFKTGWELPNGGTAQLAATIFGCEYPRFFCDHTELLELRNYMLPLAKQQHSDAVLYVDGVMADNYRRREAVERALRVALEAGTLRVYYQPIFDSERGVFGSAEALSRLEDAELGSISPDEFIAVAESTGLIVPLGFYVLEEVCTFIESYLLADAQNTITGVNVNMSVLQCAYPQLREQCLEIIHRHGVPPEMLNFELTETAMVASPELVRGTMEALRQSGIRFSLDDYGTGYSNISYLVRFPFDKVKFDKHMVWSYFDNETAHAIIKNEFEVFHTIGKEIVVEGIETKEQYETLREQGIHLFQGYYFSRAVPGEACVKAMHRYCDSAPR